MLVPIILGKLPVEIKQNLARDHPAFEWSIDELREAILKEIRIFEAGFHITPQPPTDSPFMTATFYTGAQSPHHKINKGSKDRFLSTVRILILSLIVMSSLTTANIWSILRRKGFILIAWQSTG